MTTPKSTPKVTSGKDFKAAPSTDKTAESVKLSDIDLDPTSPLVIASREVDPSPISAAEAEQNRAEEQGRNADVPNPSPQDPNHTNVPPGPGATVTSSHINQSNAVPTTDAAPVAYDKRSLYDTEKDGPKRRHISDPGMEDYKGKLDLETGLPKDE